MKRLIKKLIKALKNPVLVLDYLSGKEIVARLFTDRMFLKIRFRLIMGKTLELETPQTFNEKLQWLKLNDRKPEYTKMADKYEVRKYIAEKIGEEYLIPLLGVWDNPEDIDFHSLPEQFVLKCTHNSGLGMCVCKDKSKLDIEKTKKELKKGLRENYYIKNREWTYKNIKPRIIAEKFMLNNSSDEAEKGMIDYKFYCFNGRIECGYVSQGLENRENARISYVTLDWEEAPFKRIDYKKFSKLPQKPKNWDKMIELASILSKGHKFLRVDFYESDERIYFGELTFYPGSGLTRLIPEEWDYKLGAMITL